MTSAATARRPALRSVAVPSEHGGWGLTSEPGLLGLLVAPSAAGACLAAAAMVAFLARTPTRIVLVDLRRGRRLERTRLALVVTALELIVLAALVVGAIVLAEGAFWTPLVLAVPLVALEGSFEVRSRGRRLVPELAGSIGVSAVAAMIVLADGAGAALAIGIWMVLAARAITSIPHVRAQIARIHRRDVDRAGLVRADLAAAVTAAAAVITERSLLVGAASVLVVIALQRFSATRQVPRPAVIGIRQMAMGFSVVAATAVGVHLSPP